jgi:hypothetical protein
MCATIYPSVVTLCPIVRAFDTMEFVKNLLTQVVEMQKKGWFGYLTHTYNMAHIGKGSLGSKQTITSEENN